MWKRVHFSISDTVSGQHRRCWVMSCEETIDADNLNQGGKELRAANVTNVTRLCYLADAAGPVPHKVVPVPVGFALLVQDFGH